MAQDATEDEYRQLLAQIDSLIRRVQEVEAEKRLPFPPGHFYSPIADPADAFALAAAEQAESGDLPGSPDFRLDSRAILKWLDRIARHYPDLPFSDTRQDGLRYYYQNPAFSYGDAVVYFGMLLELKPRRVIEVGSGYSSCLAMDVNDRFLGGNVEMTFLEPYPDTLFSLIGEDDPYRGRIVAKRLQEAPTEWFKTLEARDILFIDSSHVAKTGSEVNDYLFRILPALRPGVVIHIHDIPYPFEYGRDWLVGTNRSWNEAHILRAFLQYNRAFRVIYFNHFVKRKFTDRLASKLPLCLKNCGASIWMEKRRAWSDGSFLPPILRRLSARFRPL